MLLIRLPTGGLHLVTEQERHADGVWLPSSEDARVNAKALLAVSGGGNQARGEKWIATAFSRSRLCNFAF